MTVGLVRGEFAELGSQKDTIVAGKLLRSCVEVVDADVFGKIALGAAR